MFILTLSVLFLCLGSVNTASAHETDLPEKTINEEGTSLSEVESEISPLFIPCDYYGNTHRYVKTGSKQVAKSSGKEEVYIRRPDGSLQTVICNYQNMYTVGTYHCACGDSYQDNGVFSHTYHPINHS